MNSQKITATITITLLLALTITTYQTINLQNQIIQLQQNTNAEKIIKDYLLQNYGVSSIDELIQKKLKEYGIRYTGNPFTTALYPGQIQTENITGMHWYTYLGRSLLNRTDVITYPSQPAKFIIENVSGTIIWKDGTNGTVYATGTTPTEATNIIKNNIIIGTFNNPIVAGSTDTVEDNIGYITENWVSFTNLSNGSYVAHGLAGTPDYTIITLENQGYGWVGNKNSTHIQLYFSVPTANGTVWCKYEP